VFVKLLAYEYANENSGSVNRREQVNLAEFISLSSRIVMCLSPVLREIFSEV